jgi:DNA-binding NarL/FixJ family response regulator
MIKLLLADDQASVRRGLRMRLELEPDLTVIGEAADGAEALRLTRRLRPDVVLMDLAMPGMDGIEATIALHPFTARSAVVIHSFRDDSATRAAAIAAGAFALIAKHDSAEALLAAIRQAAWQPEGLATPPLAGGGPASPGSRSEQPIPRGIRGEPQ